MINVKLIVFCTLMALPLIWFGLVLVDAFTKWGIMAPIGIVVGVVAYFAVVVATAKRKGL